MLSASGSFGFILNPILAILLIAFAALTAVTLSFRERAVRLAEAKGISVLEQAESPLTTFGFWMGALLVFLMFIIAGLLVPALWAVFFSGIGFLVLALALVLATVYLVPFRFAQKNTRYVGMGIAAVALAYLIIGLVAPIEVAGIVGSIMKQFLPVWISLFALFYLSIRYKRHLGLYGRIFDSMIGMIGLGIVMFWVFTAFYVSAFGWIATVDPLAQFVSIKNKIPGTPIGDPERYMYALLGGDNNGRDVFSRVVAGSFEVIRIAPLATLFAFMTGIVLGLPAGYFGGKWDTNLSFVANLILSFPVILLFYLLVTPEIIDTGVPTYLAAFMFIFPIIFLVVLFNSRFFIHPIKRMIFLTLIIAVGGWLYLSALSQNDTVWNFLPALLDLFDVQSGILIVFVSVVFVNSPTVFRIVRGLTLDVKSRDYVGAAQTRGEGPWYIMLWEILPNVRGPLIVDFMLRIGYVTILLGTLGFFGLGLPPDSADWGTMINSGRKLLSVYVHPALPPALALMSLVLGLNLLADGLREESLKD